MIEKRQGRILEDQADVCIGRASIGLRRDCTRPKIDYLGNTRWCRQQQHQIQHPEVGCAASSTAASAN